jgi:peptidoglycan/xylan/chitin deacetylase (PgdA/CDA1 family)
MILHIYQRFSHEIPILMYHHIMDDCHYPYTISSKQFNEQLAYLRRTGYRTITLSQLYIHRNEGKKLPQKPVIITFDDAYEDVYINALPVLKQFNMVATTFVITKYVGDFNYWDSYPNKPICRHMSWDNLRVWLDQGMEVGSHSVTHSHLSNLSKKEIFEELQNSKLMIEEKLKMKIKFFCYPYGELNVLVKKNLSAIGYQGALAIREGTSTWHNDVFALKRICITSNLKLIRFKILITLWFELYQILKLKTFIHNLLHIRHRHRYLHE